MPEAPPAPPTGSPATDASIALLVRLTRLGMRHLVVCPGSRSQALALVAAELERIGAVQLHVRIDERSAAFLALGLAVESGRPAAVITTSGTATANLHPAVLEAHHSRIPLLLLTADRPAALHGIRANQTTVQRGLYGDAVRWQAHLDAPVADTGTARYAEAADAAWIHAVGGIYSAAGADAPGPVHLNLAFDHPLSAAVPDLSVADLSGTGVRRAAGRADAAGTAAENAAGAVRASVMLPAGGRTIVIAGAGAGQAAEEVAHAGGWPLIAEASSGARFGRHLVLHYRELLRDPELGGAVERAIVFGHPTLSREVPALLARPDVEVLVVDPYRGDYVDPGHRARPVSAVTVQPGGAPDRAARAWVGRWVVAGRRLAEEAGHGAADEAAPDVAAGRSYTPSARITFARAERDAVRAPVTRRMLAAALWRFTWPRDRLVLGASRLIRVLDADAPGKNIRVHANRGLAGIDGTVSTALGIALAHGEGVTRALLGDLALLHDAGGLLLLGEGERRPQLQLVVGNDGGGTIFDDLEVAGTAPTDAFDRVLYTPQHVEIAALAGAYGWEYRRAANRGELDQALSAPPAGVSILEVPLAR